MPKWSRVAYAVASATLVGSLLSSCGNEAPRTEESVAPVSTTVGSVPVGGEVKSRGDTTTGITTSWFGDDTVTSIDTRVFRRSRTEKSDGRVVLNNRDIFVATQVARTSKGSTAATIHVDGYSTEGDDPEKYPMAKFGTNGRVSVVLTAKGTDWSPAALAWTIVSRDVLAVLFARESTRNPAAGLVEYYDLTTGGLRTSLGDDGRTVIPASFGFDDVSDLAVRAVDADGVPRLVVGGIAFDDGGEVRDVVVAGVLPDGRPDEQVGDDGSGRLSLMSFLPAPTAHAGWSLRLADPGLGVPNGSIGALVISSILGADGRPDFATPAETVATGVVARAPRLGGAVSMDPANRSFANSVSTGLSFVSVRNVVLNGSVSLDAHVNGSDAGRLIDPTTGAVNRLVSFASASPTLGVVVKDVASPFRMGPPASTREVGRVILDVSESGKTFAVGAFRKLAETTVNVHVCFGEQVCSGNENPPARPVIDVAASERSTRFVRAISAGTAGVRVLVEGVDGNDSTTDHALIGFGVDGSAATSAPVPFDGPFDVRERVVEDVGGREVERNLRSVFAPRILESDAIVATASTRPDGELNVLQVQRPGTGAVEVPLSLPLGITSYSAKTGSFATFGDDFGILSARLWSDEGIEDRLYKVDVENGSVDVAFGGTGYAVVPRVDPDDDGCEWRQRIVTGPDVIAVLTLDTDAEVADGDARCAAAPTEVSWSVFTAAGALLDSDVAISLARLDSLPFVTNDGFAVDPQGNLYVSGFSDRFDNGRWLGSDTYIAKFVSTGEPDGGFGDDGVVALSAQDADVFAAGFEAVIGVDSQSRVYLAAPVTDDQGSVGVSVARLGVAGEREDDTEGTSPTTAVTATNESPTPAERDRRLARAIERRLVFVAARAADAEYDASLSPNNGLTVVATEPVLTALRAIEDRSLTVWWATSQPRSRDYVIATAQPGGRRCASTEGSCILRGLDPSIAYTVTVERKGAQPTERGESSVAPTKPVVVLRTGRVASPTTYVRPASRGAATWKVDGGCILNETNTRLTTPKAPTTCRLSVTTEKFASTPTTTRSVTIVVQK